jgi:uncharacterized protein (DUF1501 family)
MTISRRQFLKTAGCALGAAGLVYQFNRFAAWAEAQTSSDYRALVCIFLAGGNDSLNTIVPTAAEEYALYRGARPDIAIARDQLLPIAPVDPLHASRPFGLHPKLTELHKIWGQGKLAVLCNVGTLVAPITKQQYLTDKTVRPSSLFDHAAQENQWQILPDGDTSGWGNRIGRVMQSINASPGIPLLINVSQGASVYLSGSEPYITLKNEGVSTVGGFSSTPESQKRYAALRQLQRLAPDAPIIDSVGDSISLAIDNARLASDVLADDTPLDTEIPKTVLGSQLNQIAKLIKNRDALGLNRRQIFYAVLGGFDTHGSQLAAHPKLLTELDEAVGAFFNATVDLGVQDSVTTFTLSEFGRTLNGASDGTDHGWGGHGLILGGGVKGGRFYGEYPHLIIGGDLDIEAPGDSAGRGRFLPQISVEQYAATLAKWFGMSDTAIRLALPNVGRFSPMDLGFMA